MSVSLGCGGGTWKHPINGAWSRIKRSIFSMLSKGTIYPTICTVWPSNFFKSAGTSDAPIRQVRKSLKYNRCEVLFAGVAELSPAGGVKKEPPDLEVAFIKGVDKSTASMVANRNCMMDLIYLPEPRLRTGSV